MTKRELIDMFRDQVFPAQANYLKNLNYENKGELDSQEYLRDTSVLIDLAEMGYKKVNEQKPYWNNNLPTHAKWEWDSKRFMFVCSNCKKDPTEKTGHSLDYEDLITHYRYCKSCGAIMEA